MKNGKLKYILCLVLAVVSAFAFACNKDVSLVDFKGGTERVALLSYYVVDTSNVYDTDGNAYAVTASVTDSEGEAVDFSMGRFLVTDRDGYTVKYTAKLSGNDTKSRTVTLDVFNPVKPIVRIIDGNHVAEIGEVYNLPTATAVGADGENLDITYSVLNAEGVAQTIDAENKTFTATEQGTYKVVASATDADYNAAQAEFELFVRKPIVDGEWESFDDEGSFYNVTLADRTENTVWHENVLGRDGVLQLDITSSNLSGNLFRVNPRKAVSEYADYQYVVFSMYIDADENTINDFAFLRGSNAFNVKQNVKYNQWIDYVFDGPTFVKWLGYVGEEGSYNIIRQYFWGVANQDYSIYLDRVLMTNTLEEVTGNVENVTVGEEVSLKEAITTVDGITLDYNVYLAGKLVEKTSDKFTPEWKGTYTIVAQAASPANVAVAENSFTLTAEAGENWHVAKINAYTPYIEYVEADESTHDYVLPKIEIYEADGLTPVSAEVLEEYTFTETITRKSPAGVYVYDSAFSKTIRGYLEYDLTAYHPTYGSFRMYANVTVGPIAENEVADFSKADSLKQLGSRYITSIEQTKNIYGELDPDRYQGLDILHIAKDEISGNSSSQINFIPARTVDDYQALLDNNIDGTKKVIVRFPVFVRTTDEETRKSILMTVLGVDFEVALNKWTYLEVPVESLIEKMNAGKLYAISNWSDYAIVIKPTASEPFFDENNPSAPRIDLDIFMGNITIETVDVVPPTVAELENLFTATEADLYKVTSASANANVHLASAEELAEISKGDANYTGGAAVMNFTVGNGPELSITAETRSFINNEWFPELCGYNYVSIMMAIKPAAGGITITSGLLHEYFGGNFSYSATSAQPVNEWVEYLVPIEVLLERDYGETPNKVRLIVPWFNAEASAGGAWTAYVGEIKLKKIIPTVEEIENLFIAGTDEATNIHASKGAVDATAEQLATITGGNYSGNAVTFQYTVGNGARVKYNVENLKFINNPYYSELCGYKYVSINLAVTNNLSKSTTFCSGLLKQANGGNIALGGSKYLANTWYNFIVPIEYMTADLFSDNGQLVLVWSAWKSSWTDDISNMFVGDIKLIKQAPAADDYTIIFDAPEV